MADPYEELRAFCEDRGLVAVAWSAEEVDEVVILAHNKRHVSALTAKLCAEALDRIEGIEKRLTDIAERLNENILAMPPSLS